MRQVKTKLPIYTGDVSGVPSALYELSGMVVMHDASGCNSTYNTHDELRWYTKESLIFISGMNEFDAVLGNDNRLIEEVITAAKQLKPAFVALCGTPIPFINGTDFKAITKVIEKELKIPVFFVPTNGTHSYCFGAGNAFLEFGKRFFTRSMEKVDNGVNLLGVTPLDYGLTGFEIDAKKLLLAHGLQPVCCLSMGDSLSQVKNASKAMVNLVVSATGLLLAQWMEREFEIPYVIGTLAGSFSETVCACLKEAIKTKRSIVSYQDRKTSDTTETILIGEPVISESIAAFLSERYDITVKVISPIKEGAECLVHGDCAITEEDELRKALADAKHVIGDPLLKSLCKETTTFYEVPHVACSGRIYAKQCLNLITMGEKENNHGTK